MPRKSQASKSKVSKPKPRAKTTTFPLNKLPLELREQVWEQALLTGDPSKLSPSECFVPDYSRWSDGGAIPAADPRWPGGNDLTVWYTRALPPAAHTCQESLAVANRLQRKEPDTFAREEMIRVLHSIDKTKKHSLAYLLDGGEQLVLNIDSILSGAPTLLSLRRWCLEQAHRVLELLRAAKDGQIKVCLTRAQRLSIPLGLASKVPKGWRTRTRLVSFKDVHVWEELREMAKLADRYRGCRFAEMLDDDSWEMKHYLKSTKGVLENFWKRENARRQRHGLEELGKMPEIDVAVWVIVVVSLR
ncbi:hypothetical protein OQA88_6667 [Cercophora sp. LCS_1]